MPRKTNEEIVSSDRYNMKLPDRLQRLIQKDKLHTRPTCRKARSKTAINFLLLRRFF